MTGWVYYKMTVYVRCGYDTTVDQDLDRIYTLRDLQRWVCGRQIFRSCERFED